ncbi:MAG TPA: M17 family peptidase N-terminal domain-containing protein, partial [Acidimicrobiales bacterium]
MPIAIELTATVPDDAQVTGVGVTTDQIESGDLPEGLDPSFLAARSFKGKPGETCVVARPAGAAGTSGALVAVGLGAGGETTPSTFRKAAAALARATERHERVATTLLGDAPERLDRAEVVQAIGEGIVLGAYRYTALKSEPEPSALERVTLVGDGDSDAVRAALDRGR